MGGVGTVGQFGMNDTTVGDYVVVAEKNLRFSTGKTTAWTYPGGVNTSTSKMSILSNGNVGIGTTVPTTKLDVNGTVKSVGIQITSGVTPGTTNAGKVLTSDATGNATWQLLPPGADNLGNHIATQALNMAGNNINTVGGLITGTLKVTSGVTPGATSAGKVLTSDATGVATWQTPVAGVVPPVGSNFLDTSATPQIKTGGLTVGGLITGTLKVTSGVTSAGKVLTSDATGNATWQTATAGITTITGGSCAVGQVVISISTTGVVTCGTAPVVLTNPWVCNCSNGGAMKSSSVNLSTTICNNAAAGTNWKCAMVQ